VEINMKYAYYPGCSLEGTAKDFGESTRAVCAALGIDITDVPDWICCGATPGHAQSEALGVALSVRTMINARRIAPAMMVQCAACYNRAKVSNEMMRTRPELRATVEDAIGEPHAADLDVVHMLEVLDRDLGLEAIAAKITRPLKGLKLACYYGCLLVRPPKIMNFDDAENPQIMERILAPTGAQVIADWSHKVECCGASFAMARTDVVVRCVNDILQAARAAGADAVVVACPLCQANCDMRQDEANKAFGGNLALPVLYYTQVLGLALGLEPRKLGLHRLMVPADSLLSRLSQERA
jgi:heterodisulfide reductase subunit B2